VEKKPTLAPGHFLEGVGQGEKRGKNRKFKKHVAGEGEERRKKGRIRGKNRKF
jgi:hypothetical protein